MADAPALRHERRQHGGPGIARLFAGMVIAPFAWALQMLIGYSTAAHACYPTDIALSAPLWSDLRTIVGITSVVLWMLLGVGVRDRLVELEGDPAGVEQRRRPDHPEGNGPAALHGAVRRHRQRPLRGRAAVQQRGHSLGSELWRMTATAHVEEMPATTSIPWTWEPEPVVCILLVAVAATYAAGALRQWRERRLPKDARWRAFSFAIGVGLLVLALLSPLDAWGDRLFAAHMAQHLILMMLSPPLLVLGRPVVVALWSLPQRWRHAVAEQWLRGRSVRPLMDFLGGPLPAWLLLSAALWFWHLPKPYTLAFTHPFAHALEHLSFFLTAILFWRIVIHGSQQGRLVDWRDDAARRHLRHGERDAGGDPDLRAPAALCGACRRPRVEPAHAARGPAARRCPDVVGHRRRRPVGAVLAVHRLARQR